MKRNLEIEIKFLISGNDFNYLKKLYIWDDVITQKNYYYDTNDLKLRKNGETLRVRDINGIREIQFKTRNSSKRKNTKIREEFSIECEKIPYQITHKEFPICKYDVFQIGSLITKRFVKYNNGIAICLDMNDYLNERDYELEIEYDSKNYYEVTQIIKELGSKVKLINTGDGKYTRFIKKLLSENNEYETKA